MSVPYYTSKEISEHHGQIESALKHPNWFSRSGYLKEILKEVPRSAAIADMGSGSGELARQLFALGFTSVVCVDIDDYLERSALGGLPAFAQADLSKDRIPLEDASVDVAFAIQVLEHLENPWHAARELIRITKRGGKMVVAIPHATSFVNRLKFLFTGNIDTYTEKNNHIALFTRALFTLLWRGQIRVSTQYAAEGYVKLFGLWKLRFKQGTWLAGRFTRKIAYVLERV